MTIKWFEQPTNYPYLRTSPFDYTEPKLTKSVVMQHKPSVYKLIGYQLVSHDPSIYNEYTFTIYYLKQHDLDKTLELPPDEAIKFLNTTTYIRLRDNVQFTV